MSPSPRLVRSLAPLLLVPVLLAGCGWASETAAPSSSSTGTSTPKATKKSHPKSSATATESAAAPTVMAADTSGKPSDQRTLRLIRTIGGQISPKSVVASRTGLVFAQNMMYRHTMTVYSSKTGALVRTIPDSVRLASFGVSGHPGTSKGAPVEAAFSHDGRYAYVSNYSMYGSGFGPEGSDTCTPSSAKAAGVSPSFVYRVDVAALKIDKVKQVGRVPKYVAVTPDDKLLLVTDWCSDDLRIIDIASWKQLASVPMNAIPRGIAVTPDSRTAYVAVMGSSHLAEVDLATRRVTHTIEVGSAPRHVVMDPAGRYAYVTLNGANQVVKVDLRKRRVVDRVSTGSQPRSMDIAPDGRTLYVVDYLSSTVAKVRASDLRVLQRIKTGVHPIGITYDPTTNDVWVAVYTGSILVLSNK